MYRSRSRRRSYRLAGRTATVRPYISMVDAGCVPLGTVMTAWPWTAVPMPPDTVVPPAVALVWTNTTLCPVFRNLMLGVRSDRARAPKPSGSTRLAPAETLPSPRSRPASPTLETCPKYERHTPSPSLRICAPAAAGGRPRLHPKCICRIWPWSKSSCEASDNFLSFFARKTCLRSPASRHLRYSLCVMPGLVRCERLGKKFRRRQGITDASRRQRWLDARGNRCSSRTRSAYEHWACSLPSDHVTYAHDLRHLPATVRARRKVAVRCTGSGLVSG